MQGGIALKIGYDAEEALAALREAAHAEGIALKETSPRRLEEDPRRDDEPPVQLALGRHRGYALFLEESRAEERVLAGIADALAIRLRCPIGLVVDTDDGAELLRGWNGGEEMSPRTGRASWGDPADRHLELVAPPHVPLAEDEARALLVELDAALPPELRALGSRFVAIAKRDVAGPIGVTLPAWQLTLSAPGEAPLYMFARTTGPDEIATLAAGSVDRAVYPCRDEEPSSPYRARTAVPPSFLEALARHVSDAEILAVERRGFRDVTFHARVRIDGEDSELELRVFSPRGDEPDAWTVRKFETAVVSERRRRSETRQRDLEAALLDQLRRGEIEGAAATYRARHASYFGGMDEEEARAASLAKIQDLRRLYRLP